MIATASIRVWVAGTLAAAAGLGMSCQKTLPSAPTDLTSGITIYEHAEFSGASALLTSDARDLSDYKGPCRHETYSQTGSYYYYDWEDCISSIRVAPGWRATIFKDSGFDGHSVTLTTDMNDLELLPGTCKNYRFNDCISSIRVEPPK